MRIMRKITKPVFRNFFKYSQDLEEDWYCFKTEILAKFKGKENLLTFMAQVAHESNYLKYKAELWSYSRSALLKVFPKYFNEANVGRYVRSPNALSRAYANRMGNGPESSGDGFKYRGRGYIQLTGKNNYRKYGYLGRPEKLLNCRDAWVVSLAFWKKNKLDQINDIKRQTRIINGGYNGLSHRVKCYRDINRMVF